MSHSKSAPTSTVSQAKTPHTPAGTVSAGEQNASKKHTGIDDVVSGESVPAAGPDVVGPEKASQTHSKVLSEGHKDDAVEGRVTEVISDIEPTVPTPPAPNAALGIDPSHPTLDSYPSEAAASTAPGIHVDLTARQHPVGVITHQQPPFHRVDGQTPGVDETIDESIDSSKNHAEHSAGKGHHKNS